MSLKIPKEFISGFKKLNDLSIEDVNRIASFISTIPSGTGPKEFISLLSTKFTIDGLSELSSTIYSLGSILLNFDESVEEISKMLNKAIIETIEKDIAKDKPNNLEEKLFVILSNADNLKFTFKALNLISDNDIIYRNGRIFSDIRLLFNENIKENKNNRKAVIIHRLKIESNKNDEDKDYYFSLDSNDLHKMKELINRAIMKDKQIKSDYSNDTIPQSV